ncbi:MAG: DNA-formamidopyrimidine glycosylase family protein [bacterium]
MPELPDVELFKRYLNRTALHKTISAVHIDDRGILSRVRPRRLRRVCDGGELRASRRHGKHLFARVDGAGWLRLHFGMTGFLKYYRDDDRQPAHTRLRLEFENGFSLAYDCQRKLGEVGLVSDVDDFIEREGLGLDPLEDDLPAGTFADLLSDRRGTIKSLLMNQGVLAGIGNIYSDEILFQTGLDPRSEVRALDGRRRGRLLRTIKRVLRKAIDYHVDPDRFPPTYLLPHRDDGVGCPRCGGKIRRIRLSGRSAYICDRHQERLME